MSRFLFVLVLAVSSMTWTSGSSGDPSAITINEERKPYILIATSGRIFRMNLNGSNRTTLVHNQAGIIAMDYHYESDLLFWATQGNGGASIKYTSLSNPSALPTSLNSTYIKDPVGLALDWINNKLYWVDRDDKAVFVYDLQTYIVSRVVSLENHSTPSKLKIYPQPNAGWLYLANKTNIYRIPLNRSSNEPVMMLETFCTSSLALDYKARNIYMSDGCDYHIETSKMDGSGHRPIQFKETETSGFSYGAALYKDELFWIENKNGLGILKCFNITISAKHTVYNAPGRIFYDIQVVHATNQPSASDLVNFSACTQGCVHGNCVSPGQCSCAAGWRGKSCDEDINECQSGQLCDQNCVNTKGSFECECREGFDLMSDQRNCLESTELPTDTTSQQPETTPTKPETTPANPETIPTTSNPETTPESKQDTTEPSGTTPSTNPETVPTTGNQQATTGTTPSTNPETVPTTGNLENEQATTGTTPSTKPETTPTTRVPETTSNEQDTTDATPTITSGTTPTITPGTSTKPETTPIASTKPETTPIASTKPETTPTIHEDITTGNIQETTPTNEDITITPRLGFTDNNQDGLKSSSDGDRQTLVIVGVVLAAAGLIVAVIVVMYLVILYFKYKVGKTGSYDVYRRHSVPRRERIVSLEDSGTSSVHSSFRDITQEYNHRSRVLEGVAELGCAGEMRQVEGDMTTVLRNIPPLGGRDQAGDADRRRENRYAEAAEQPDYSNRTL